MFDYGTGSDDDEEAGYRFGAHTFSTGEYVSIRDHADVQKPHEMSALIDTQTRKLGAGSPASRRTIAPSSSAPQRLDLRRSVEPKQSAERGRVSFLEMLGPLDAEQHEGLAPAAWRSARPGRRATGHHRLRPRRLEPEIFRHDDQGRLRRADLPQGPVPSRP
jgi:hypothetical protein